MIIFAQSNAPADFFPIQFVNEANITDVYLPRKDQPTLLNGVLHVDKILQPPGNLTRMINEDKTSRLLVPRDYTKNDTTVTEGSLYAILDQFPETYSIFCSYLQKDDEMFTLTSQYTPNPSISGPTLLPVIPRVTLFAPTN